MNALETNAVWQGRLIDTHCHLDSEAYAADRYDVIARTVGTLRGAVTIGTDLASGREVQRLARATPGVAYTSGVHPHHAAEHSPEQLAEVREIVASDDCIAIGECGLDYHYDNSPRDVQRACFREQLVWASALDKPVVLHIREAFDDALAILRDSDVRRHGGEVHSFTGTRDELYAALDLGLCIGINGIVTFKKSALAGLLSDIPRDRLLLETDAPYLAPTPLRGTRNEPMNVQHVAQFLLDAGYVSTAEELIALSCENAQRLFRRAF